MVPAQRRWCVADLDHARAEAVAAAVDGAAFKCDVAQERDILHVIEETEQKYGPIALFCSNAGIERRLRSADGQCRRRFRRTMGPKLVDPVMAHVYAARHLIPRMKARGAGYFLNTISAAGLLSQIGSPAYSTPNMPRSALPRIWRSRIAPTASRFRSCVRRCRDRHAARIAERTAIRRW